MKELTFKTIYKMIDKKKLRNIFHSELLDIKPFTCFA